MTMFIKPFTVWLIKSRGRCLARWLGALGEGELPKAIMAELLCQYL